MRKYKQSLLVFLWLICLVACSSHPPAANLILDAPEEPRPHSTPFQDAASYPQALQVWRTPEDLNAWINTHFIYDPMRAIALSETQRGNSTSIVIFEPVDFFASPSGVCVDLSRFAVETLWQIAPETQPNYLMIEFAPIELEGNTLRLHWLAMFRREGHYFFMADSQRPGHLAGPYASLREFITEYSRYRGRPITGYQELASYERTPRTIKPKQLRQERR